MSGFDIKKFVLYFALAAVGLTLWQNWQKEHPQIAPTNTVSHTAARPVADSSHHLSSFNQHHPAASVPAKLSETQLIQIKTNKLQLKLSPLGGDIVEAGLSQYPVNAKQNDQPYLLLDQNTNKHYTSESGFIGINQNKPLFFSTPKNNYQLGDDKTLQINLTWSSPNGIRVDKQIRVTKDSYIVRVKNIIHNGSANPIQIQQFNQLSRTPPKKQTGFLHAMTTFTGGAYSTPEKHYNKVSFKALGQKKVDQSVQGGWIAMEQQYFLSAWIPQSDKSHHFYSLKNDDNIYTLGMLSPKTQIKSGEDNVSEYKLYLGPELVNQLELAAPHLKLTIDYGWLWFISIIILWLLEHIHAIVGNWGWSIILVTVLIKAAFYHLSASSYRSMARMRQLQPRIQALKERCGDDKQKFSQSMMGLYKEEKVNPFGGCLPILIQIPVFIALYWVLLESVQLRQAPFMLWIHDLAAPDPYFILPVVMGVTMFIQQKLSPAPPDPTQAKIMMFLPVIFTVFFFNFPAGLVLYWVVNNTLSILQQWFVMRQINKT